MDGGGMRSGPRPKVMVTNDDGIDAPGLRALVQALISTARYDVLVCAPHTERSAASHAITWHHTIFANRVEIEGATAYAVSGGTTNLKLFNAGAATGCLETVVSIKPVRKLNTSVYYLSNQSMRTPADCASLGISQRLFDGPPDLVISGINMGSNAGYHIVYSGTVAGAREAFLYGVPSIAISYDWKGGKSSINDFKIGAEACLPIISAIIGDIKNKTYPRGSFLNIDLPTNIVCHKGYKVTKQGKSMIRVGWRQIKLGTQGGKSSLPMDMEVDLITGAQKSSSTPSQEQLVFKREANDQVECEDNPDLDYVALKEGYISVTPLGALSAAETDAYAFYKDWMLRVSEPSASAL